MFAQYVDLVDDPRDISGVSRFLSGGIGGISSQLSPWFLVWVAHTYQLIRLFQAYIQ